jgi:transposase
MNKETEKEYDIMKGNLRLRKELAKSQKEVAFLKKEAAFFEKEVK